MTAAPETLDLDYGPPPPGGTVLHQTARSTVIWGDCRDPAVIATVPAGYGLLCTDPPYGVNYRSSHGQNFAKIQGDDGTVDWPAILAEWVGADGTWTRGLGHCRHLYVFGYTPDQLAAPLRLGGSCPLIWNKDQPGLGDLTQPWGLSHEVITFGVHVKTKSGRERVKDSLAARLRRGSVLRAQRPSGRGVTRHPTEKPVALMAQLIESSTTRGDLVVDPCAGSGSTGVAAVLEGRRAFLVEIDRKYAELAVQRVIAAERIADLIDAA